jgi:3'(2'), 5'-bisphosphate nucleotidase
MQENLNIAIKAALEAGKAILEIYESGDFDVTVKGDDSPLTKADVASHNVIVSFLEKTGIPILSEEGKAIPYEVRKDWNQLWIVDPIDGTKEFIKRNGEFTVNIALIENQIPVLGVIYVPAYNQLYFSAENFGSYRVDNICDFENFETLQKAAIKLPQVLKKENYTIVASKSHLSPETEDYINSLEKTHGVVDTLSKGSSLKLCMVAEGQADCYPRFAPTMEWDTAAGQAICSFAGKTVMDYITKKEMLYNRENLLNNWFLVN